MLVQASLISGSALATYGILWLRRLYKRHKARAMSDGDLTKAVRDNIIPLYEVPCDRRDVVEKGMNVLMAGYQREVDPERENFSAHCLKDTSSLPAWTLR